MVKKNSIKHQAILSKMKNRGKSLIRLNNLLSANIFLPTPMGFVNLKTLTKTQIADRKCIVWKL